MLSLSKLHILNKKETRKFLKKVKDMENVPSYPKSDPDRLEEARLKAIKLHHDANYGNDK